MLPPLPQCHPTRKPSSQTPLWTAEGPDDESHGTELGTDLHGGILMNVRRWSAQRVEIGRSGP